MNDWVYGLNAVTGAVNWKMSLGAPCSRPRSCADATPNTGVMSTPVYDPRPAPSTWVRGGPGRERRPPRLLPARAQRPDRRRAARLAGADPRRPRERPDQGSSARSARWQRPGLLLLNGTVYAGFGSHCDWDPVHRLRRRHQHQDQGAVAWTDEKARAHRHRGRHLAERRRPDVGRHRPDLPRDRQRGVTGGRSGQRSRRASSPTRWSSWPSGLAARCQPRTSSARRTLRRWTATDGDLGSGGPVGLPFGTTADPHLLVQAGKDAHVYLLNRDSLGGRKQGPGGSDKVVSVAGPYRGQWGHPAAFGSVTRGDQVQRRQVGPTTSTSSAPAKTRRAARCKG